MGNYAWKAVKRSHDAHLASSRLGPLKRLPMPLACASPASPELTYFLLLHPLIRHDNLPKHERLSGLCTRLSSRRAALILVFHKYSPYPFSA